MAYLLMISVALVGTVVYLFFIMNAVPGAKEERFGALEDLPPDVGKWKVDTASASAKQAEQEGLIREVRHFYHESQRRLAFQVRYRDRETKKIARIDPEETVPRRRVRPS